MRLPAVAASWALSLALTGTLAACSGGGNKSAQGRSSPGTTRGPVTGATSANSTSVTPIPNCLGVPEGKPLPPWLPKDLPMPPGTAFVEEIASPGTAKVGRFVVSATIQEFVRFALTEYPKAGWRLGRGDSEPGEAEDGFSRGLEGGAWRVRSSLCDTSKSELFLTYATNISAAPTFTSAPPPTVAPSTTAPPP